MMKYAALMKKIKAMPGAKPIGFADNAERYPLYMLRRGKGKKVLLTGVVHGDEPAGAHAILSFFQKHISEYEDEFEFTAFPCVNPWGLEHSYRLNADSKNLNREFFKNSGIKEIRLLTGLFEKYIFTIDFHETWDEPPPPASNEPAGAFPEDFYLYEICDDKNARVGHKIVENVEKAGLSVCKWPIVYGDRNNNGVIWYPEDCGTVAFGPNGGTFDNYLFSNHTKQSFTIETFREWPMKKRILADIISLRTVLDEKRKR